MSVSVEKLENSMAKLTIEVAFDELLSIVGTLRLEHLHGHHGRVDVVALLAERCVEGGIEIVLRLSMVGLIDRRHHHDRQWVFFIHLWVLAAACQRVARTARSQ